MLYSTCLQKIGYSILGNQFENPVTKSESHLVVGITRRELASMRKPAEQFQCHRLDMTVY